MRIKMAVTVLGLGLAASVVPLRAHHSVAATFNTGTTITIKGLVTKTEWMNPHARFWVDAKNVDGTVSNWELELPPPNALKREGLNRDFLSQGDQVTVNLWQAKDGSKVAHALTLTVPGGRVMNFPTGWGMPANQN
jgi:chitodextrinase